MVTAARPARAYREIRRLARTRARRPLLTQGCRLLTPAHLHLLMPAYRPCLHQRPMEATRPSGRPVTIMKPAPADGPFGQEP